MRIAKRLCLLWAIGCAAPAFAIDRIVIEADELTVPGTTAEEVAVTLDLTRASPTMHAQVNQATRASGITLDCASLIVKEPVFACRDARVSIKKSALGPVRAQAFAEYNTDSSVLSFGLDRLAIAGGKVQALGSLHEGQWKVTAQANGVQSNALRAFIKPWLVVPASLCINGALNAQLQASGQGSNIRFDGTIKPGDFGFSNEEGTIAAEKVAASLSGKGSLVGTELSVDARILGTAGQALAGPVLLDFGANPLDVQIKGALKGQTVRLDSIAIDQKSLLQAHAKGRVTLGAAPLIEHAHADIDSVEFPAAYTSFAQLPLATTDFGQL